MITIDWLRLQTLLGEQGKIWLALSGGVDSVVLLHLLVRDAPSELRDRVAAIHVHHGLSQNADTWLEFCKTLCSNLEVDFCFERVTLEGKGSIEEQARKERYRAFDKVLRDGDVLLQAHHANDQAETILFRLERGCGWRGIQGIPEERSLGVANIFRPLLKTPRADIEEYATRLQLSWVEDESNEDTRYRRNFLRHKVLAPWQDAQPNIAKHIAQSVDRIQAEGRVIKRLLGETLERFVDQNDGLQLNMLPEQERGFWLSSYLSDRGISITQQQQMALVEMFYSHHQNQPEFLHRRHRIVRYKNVLHVLPKALPVVEQNIAAGQWLIRAFDRVYCDQEVVIKPRPDNVLLHLKNGKTRPLKKWLQDKNIPNWWREQIPYIYVDDELVAIADLWQASYWQGNVKWEPNGKLLWPSQS